MFVVFVVIGAGADVAHLLFNLLTFVQCSPIHYCIWHWGGGVSMLVIFVGVACSSFNPLVFTCYCCIWRHGGVSVFIVFVGVVLVLVWHVCCLTWCSPIRCCIWHWVGVNGFVIFVGIVLVLMWRVCCLTHWHWCGCLPVHHWTTAAAVVCPFMVV